jgi:DeoR/GlpR family transcriptional regulator of sugar metabolism
MERHCSVAELSKQWGFSENTIRRLFRKESGVIKIVHQEILHKRGYTGMRIPERIAQHVHRRLQGIA